MKYYVVWEGRAPGIYDSWEDAEEQVEGYPGAKFKSFGTLEAATKAFRGKASDHMALISAIARHEADTGIIYERFPEIKLNALTVDAACSKNPGPVEYRGVWLANGQEAFRKGPFPGGSNNMGEFIALVHGLAYLQQIGRPDIPIYSDSDTGRCWLRNCKAKCTIPRSDYNQEIYALFDRAMNWIRTHAPQNPVLEWKTNLWGQIPADFGRK